MKANETANAERCRERLLEMVTKVWEASGECGMSINALRANFEKYQGEAVELDWGIFRWTEADAAMKAMIPAIVDPYGWTVAVSWPGGVMLGRK